MDSKNKCSYSIGMIFDIDNELYVLALVSTANVALIGLSTGNRWLEPVHVKNIYCITPEAWDKIVGDDFSQHTQTFEFVGRIENIIKRREKWKK